MPLKNNKTEDAKNVSKTKIGSYGWMQGPWGPCSVFCGGGIMRRKASRCIHIDGQKVSIVNSRYCSGAKKPKVEVKTCNEKRCPIVYVFTDCICFFSFLCQSLD